MSEKEKETRRMEKKKAKEQRKKKWIPSWTSSRNWREPSGGDTIKKRRRTYRKTKECDDIERKLSRPILDPREHTARLPTKSYTTSSVSLSLFHILFSFLDLFFFFFVPTAGIKKQNPNIDTAHITFNTNSLLFFILNPKMEFCFLYFLPPVFVTIVHL